MEEEYLKFLRESIKKNEEEAKKALAKKRQEQIDKLLSNSGLGKRFQKRTFETLENTFGNYDARIKAIQFVDNFPDVKGLLFVGPVGVGKTHIAAAIANELIRKFYVVIFRNISDIVTSLLESENRYEIINTLTNADLLIIDDLGKEHITDYISYSLYEIVNKLYENEKPLIVTTNLNSQQLQKPLGERGAAIISRLTEMCDPVMVTGEDWRLKNARSGREN